jgi:integrase
LDAGEDEALRPYLAEFRALRSLPSLVKGPVNFCAFALLANWKSTIGDEGYILRSINRHGHFGSNLHPASISTILKALQKDLKMAADEQSLSGHSFRVGAALDLLEQGEPLERIMLRGGWQTDSTAMKYLRNRCM